LDLVRLERAVIGYRTPLLPPLDLVLRAGETLGVLGPNGAGKTALLKSLLGLIPLLGGKRILPSGRMPRVGYVPQRDRLDVSWPLTVLDVVLMGRTGLIGLLRRPGARDRESCRLALSELVVGDLADRPLFALSGGQHQRVLIARALAAEPELLVLDEPTSAMDPAAERVLLELVQKLKTAHNLSVVLVTHQLTAVAGFATDVALIDRERQVLEVGAAAEMLTGERLGKLYGRSVTVAEVGGQTAVVIGGPNSGNGSGNGNGPGSGSGASAQDLRRGAGPSGGAR
jgi:manganese/iron transport system ATP-binding protein